MIRALPRPQRSVLALVALVAAACGGGSGAAGPAPAAVRVSRGAVTARTASAMTVNGVQLSLAGAAVRVDDQPGGLDDVQPGDVVRVKGTFDDRSGAASEIEVEHGIEGKVDDKGIDFVVVGGQRIQVDDSTHFDDRLAGGLDAVFVGSVIRISGAPVAGIPGAADDRGGLRASRIDRSPRDGGSPADDDHLDVKGFVSALDTGARSFQLRASPDAAGWFAVSYGGIALPAGVGNGAYVEVHTATAPVPGTPPVIASLAAAAIRVEDALEGGDVELEGWITTVSGSTFVVAGVGVVTSGATRYELGVAADVAVGVRVEVEGPVDGSGLLHAEKVTFRAGARITALVEGYTGTSMTLLGIPVQLPGWLEDDLSVPLANGARVEVRGNPTADGAGVVATRLVDPTAGNAARVFLRAPVTARAGTTLTVLGYAVDVSGAAFTNADATDPTSGAALLAAVEPGRTVVKVRAASLADVDVAARTWVADEVELEGND